MTDRPIHGENRPTRSSNGETSPEDPTVRDATSIDPEQVVALLEGRLPEAEREALLARLDASPDALGAYADAIAVLREVEAGGASHSATGGNIQGGARSSAWFSGTARWIGLAATLIIAVTVAVLWPGRGALPNPHRAIARIDPPLAVVGAFWRQVPWTEMRGADDLLTDRARGVRIGARIVDFELLARHGDSAATPVAMLIAALLDGVPAGSPAAGIYRALAVDVASRSDSALMRAASFAEQVAGVGDVRLGAWLRTAQLAATQRDAAFFSSDDARQAVRAAQRSTGAESALALAQLQRAIDAAPDVPNDWAGLDAALAHLLGRLATP